MIKRKPISYILVTLIASFTILIAAHGTTTGKAQSASIGVAIPPDGSAFYGVQLSWDDDTPAAYASRLGKTPVVYGDYRTFPLSSTDMLALSQEVDQIAAIRGKLMLTLEPWGGLSTVTWKPIHDLVSALANYNSRGVDVFVRFAQEMNGSWYPWCQQPAAYITAFRKIARNVHLYAPNSVMVWGPNYGGRYPFNGGAYNAQPGTTDFETLDTNRDGVLTMDDNPYSPYYPGDSYVDWVGFTDYHWGNSWPWGENDLPEAGTFVANLTGKYNGLLGDERALPNFYATYAVRHNKPFVLTETSALYNPDQPEGASNYDIKMDWANQVFASNLTTQFPHVKMILWFEHYKSEIGTGTVDWRVTYDPTILAGYQSVLPSWLIFAT
ncbi:MAG TPA: hypothetical protein VF844_22735 [Ktedonobacteraceae bacterium]